MHLVVTDALREYIRGRPEGVAAIIVRAGMVKSTMYRMLKGGVATINDDTTAALARGLGLTEKELLAISLGRDLGEDERPCAGKPDWLQDLCREWDNIPAVQQNMIEATVRVALRQPSPAADRGRDERHPDMDLEKLQTG